MIGKTSAPHLISSLIWCAVVVLVLYASSQTSLAAASQPQEPESISDTSPVVPNLNGGTRSDVLQGGAGSTMLQTGTQSTMLQGGTGSTMLQTGTQSTLLQGGTGSTMLHTGTSGSLIHAGVERQGGPVNILFLVDASYSMDEKIPGSRHKMNAAKLVLEQAMQRIPNHVNVGLRVFGQGRTGVDDIDCKQSALLVPLGTNNRVGIIRRVGQLQPTGLTPLTYALQQAASDDLRFVKGPKTIVLISDGADTCNEDPCSFIKLLPKFGIHIKVDIVGLDLKKDPAARAQLNCISKQSGGKYYDADTAAELVEKISHIVDTAISGQVIVHPELKAPPMKNLETPPNLMPQHPAYDSPPIP